MNLVYRALADNTFGFISINTASNTSTVSDLVTKVVSIISLVVGILAFFYLIYSGILYITAAGNPDQAKKGQQGIINAIIGVIICVAAYSIVTAVAHTASNTITNSNANNTAAQ